MPLPDERPRQSVANLIGRFEQTKRPSTSATGSRSSSVVSHTTGDSAKEEVKEKREWPPKSSATSERPPIIIPSSSWTRRNAEAQPSSPPNPEPLATQAGPIEDPAILTPRPTSTTSIPDNTKAIPLPERQETIGVSSEAASKTPTATTPKPPVKAPTLKTPATTTPKTPLKALVKPQAKPTPAAQPLRPQHTGPAAAARKSVAKPPATPIRAKTPSRTPAATPAAAVRPKTPSSGLFAPTAASLARARNAQPLPPTPTKKVTLSSSSADRLSKPTAASLSRARTPTSTVSSPARGIAKPAVRGGATRGAPKPRVSTTTTRPKKDGVSHVPKAGSVAVATLATGAALGAAVTLDAEHSLDEGDSVHDEQEHPSDSLGSNIGSVTNEVHEEQGPVNVRRESCDELEEASGPAEEEQEIQIDVVDTSATEIQETDEPAEIAPIVDDLAQQPEAETHDFDNDTSATSDSETMSISEDRVDEVKPRVHAGDDIEDMVNLLESATISKVRPASIASIPDEVHEIPDEE